MWMLVRIRETWGTKFSGLSPLGVTLWSESCCHLLSVLSNTGGETRTLNHTSWIYFTQHKLNILYTTQVPRDLCRTDLIMSCHFVWVMEKYLVLLRFKEMRIKEHPEAGRLHHQLSREQMDRPRYSCKDIFNRFKPSYRQCKLLACVSGKMCLGGVRWRGEVEGGHRMHGVVQVVASWTGARIWGWSRWTHS